LGPSRGIVIQGYVVALVEVGVGATIATLFVAGWPPLVAVWGTVKPAHAWLNLVGFASLVVATTLLHFFPTVVGARIAVRPTARLTVLCLAAGPVLVAFGFGLGVDLLGRLGGGIVIAGAVALALYAWQTWTTRGKWTTDRDWHRLAIGGLVSALTWFGVGIAVAAGRVIVFGTAPAAWSIEAVFGPLVVGWIGLAVLASASHLLPAVGPGDLAAHGRQRRLLGRWATGRLVAADVGVAALSVGLPLGSYVLVITGLGLAGISLGATAFLLAGAVRAGLQHAVD
jgi:hypothetical protein